MSILVIGGDRLGNIDKNLKQAGFNRIEHIDGRKKRHTNVKISQGTDMVLVLTDFVSHNLSKSIKEKAKEIGCKAIFSRRSWADISTSISL